MHQSALLQVFRLTISRTVGFNVTINGNLSTAWGVEGGVCHGPNLVSFTDRLSLHVISTIKPQVINLKVAVLKGRLKTLIRLILLVNMYPKD